MKRITLLILFPVITIFLSGSVSRPDSQSDFEMLRNKLISSLLSGRINENSVKELMTSLKEDGSWPGIDYEDLSLTGFRHSRHAGNIVEMARAYKSKGTTLTRNKKLKQSIDLALGFWLEKDFIADNWWYNQIGIPTQFCNFLLIMDKDLTEDQVDRTGRIVSRANLSASGARPSGDRIKIAGILAKHLLFKRDAKAFDEIIRVIEGEIKFATERGMQYDYSFHHRPDRVNNTLSYGLDYADVFAEWAEFVAGTKYKFSEKPTNQLIDYYLDGICKMMAFGKFPDTGARNRDISRGGGNGNRSVTTPRRLIKVSDYRKTELEQIIRLRMEEDQAIPVSHSTFFWLSEHFTFQRPGFFTSVRMHSTRNHNMEEPYNGEGLKNHHRGDGANYITRTGQEYNEIIPVYDWQKIPGTTVLQKPELPSENEIQKIGLTDFVGAVTDGTYGAVVFDFKSPHDPVSARKSWFFFDEQYVCLGAAIASRSSLPLVTTVNQCKSVGTVTAMIAGKSTTLDKGDHQLGNLKWILHDGIGYYFPGKQKIHISNKIQTGNWYQINHQKGTSKEEISKDVFSLWFDHGNRPVNESYQYIVFPSTDRSGMESFDTASIKILSNSPDFQAVYHRELNIIQAVFYRTGEIKINDGLSVGIDSPGILMLKIDGNTIKQIDVSDPSRKLGRIHLSVTGRYGSGRNFKSSWYEQGISELAIDLPGGQFAGSTVTILPSVY